MIPSLLIREQNNTPHIMFDAEERRFVVKGRSFPENAKKYYAVVQDWFDELPEPLEGMIHFEFELSYVSSSSIISILSIIRRINELNEAGTSVSVSWHYDIDDEDIRKIGEDYKRLFNIPFSMIAN